MNNTRTCERCGTSWTADELLPCPECKTPLDGLIRDINEFCAKWRGPNTLTVAYNEALLERDRPLRSRIIELEAALAKAKGYHSKSCDLSQTFGHCATDCPDRAASVALRTQTNG